jgi:hypothetical protein
LQKSQFLLDDSCRLTAAFFPLLSFHAQTLNIAEQRLGVNQFEV